MIRRPPRSTLFPTRRSSDLPGVLRVLAAVAVHGPDEPPVRDHPQADRKSTRLNSSHVAISYAVFCLKKKKNKIKNEDKNYIWKRISMRYIISIISKNMSVSG